MPACAAVECERSEDREFEFGDARGQYRPSGGWCPLCRTAKSEEEEE